MKANYVQRLRLTFSKVGPTRFIGHLDLSRTLERSFNRARIPIAYSQGFNRRPRMSLAAALPLGFTSEFELADIWLTEELDPAFVRQEMMQKMAPGIFVNQIEPVPLAAPSLQSVVVSATYVVTMLDEMNVAALQETIAQVLSAESLPWESKRGKGKVKEVDLRPLIIDLAVDHVVGDAARIHMVLYLSPGKSGRPDDVLAALGIDPHATLIHRTMITLSEPAIGDTVN